MNSNGGLKTGRQLNKAEDSLSLIQNILSNVKLTFLNIYELLIEIFGTKSAYKRGVIF